MIYVGLINFNASHRNEEILSSVLRFYTPVIPTIIRKNSLTICYSKLSPLHDMDEIWENRSTVLLGRIFNKVSDSSFKKEEFKNLSYLNKEEVLAKMWGKYIYINDSNEMCQYEVVIDSTGQLPFFYYVFPNGNILFSSNIEIIFKALSLKVEHNEHNWTYLYSYLIYGNSSAIQTPFKNIFELPPGCCLKITKKERKTEIFWNPLSSYRETSFRKQNAADILQTTLKAWIEPYKNICVSLSGGLDSSSLVYCLNNIKKKNQILSALNYFHTSIKSSNELSYARRVCEETGIDLLEIDISTFLPFDPFDYNQPLKPNKPFPGVISLSLGEHVFNALPKKESCAYINGHGSDNIFMRPPSKKSIADYILEKGIKGYNEHLSNIASFYRDPIWPILKENIIALGAYFCSKRLNKRHPQNIYDEIPDWITPSARKTFTSGFVHPIYEYLPSRVVPGKYEQIDAIYEGLASIHVEKNQINPTYFPFLCEPVVEFALSFPTYQLFDKGYDRYPLRKAVSDRFKTDTVWRRDKSQTTGLFQLGIKKNLKYVLEICLEGQFVKQDFVEREGLYKTIMLISTGDIKNLWPFIHLVSAEIFLKQWNSNLG